MTEKIRELLAAAKVDMVLLTDAASMRYLSGFSGEGYVIATGEWRRIVTDSRYTIAARAQSPDFEVIEWDKKGYYRPVMDAVRDPKIRSVGYEDLYMTVASFRKFEKRLEKHVRLKPLGDKADLLRQVKTGEEIDRIREAEAIGDRAFARLMLDFGVSADELGVVGKQVSGYHEATPLIPENTTEKQVAARLEFYLKDEGGEALSFETIAACGLHGAMPHAVPTDRKLQKGELLTLDFGCVYQGYCSDMTRTVAVGDPAEELKAIYRLVKEAQETALAGIRPGMTGREIDALARDVIREQGHGKHFGHSLGHSVGLKIHEKPGFSSKEKTVIRPGMVVSVEPGVYVEGLGGVRIEDLIVVTEDGIENLSRSVKSLIKIKGGMKNERRA
ncbi:MAG: aminopeptidase P family protein [Eubacterium sp.]|nr:aminopeptidase P family protein [Eubacterium sp.]